MLQCMGYCIELIVVCRRLPLSLINGWLKSFLLPRNFRSRSWLSSKSSFKSLGLHLPLQISLKSQSTKSAQFLPFDLCRWFLSNGWCKCSETFFVGKYTLEVFVWFLNHHIRTRKKRVMTHTSAPYCHDNKLKPRWIQCIGNSHSSGTSAAPPCFQAPFTHPHVGIQDTNSLPWWEQVSRALVFRFICIVITLVYLVTWFSIYYRSLVSCFLMFFPR